MEGMCVQTASISGLIRAIFALLIYIILLACTRVEFTYMNAI